MSNETKTESLLITLCRSEQAAEDYFQSLCINQKSYHYPKKGFRAGAQWMHDNVVPILAAKDREIAELKRQNEIYGQRNHNIEQILGRALGFAELDGVIVTSEYNAEILAGMAAGAITKRTDALKYYYKLASEKVAAYADRPMSEAYIEANACKVLLEILLSK